MARIQTLRASGSLVTAVAAATALTLHSSAASTKGGAARIQETLAPIGAPIEPLFTQVDATVSRLPSPFDKHTRRRATLKVSEKALAAGAVLNADAVLMNLFADVQIVAIRNRVESRPRGDYSWFGYIPGDPVGRVVITVVGGQLAATAIPHGRRYVVVPAGDGTHAVFEMDLRSFPEADDTTIGSSGKPPVVDLRPGRFSAGVPLDFGGLIRIYPWGFERTNGQVPGMQFIEDPGDSVDIMVVYSRRAECVLRFFSPCNSYEDPFAGPQQIPVLAQMAVDLANQSFVDSHVETQLHVIGSIWGVADFQEVSLGDDHVAIRDGQVAGVHYQRDERAADMVVLVTWQPAGQGCGIMPIRGNFAGEADAYAVIDVFCMIGGWTLAHEIGHGFGAGHDWETADAQTPAILDLDAHGFISRKPGVTHAKRTIMSYNKPCETSGHDCEQVGRWSDPNETIDGYVLGIHRDASPKPAHNQNTLNNNRDEVANNRHSVCRFLSGC